MVLQALSKIMEEQYQVLSFGNGNIYNNPQFFDIINKDYRLSNFSPCIGAGDASFNSSFDLDGNLRPNPAGLL